MKTKGHPVECITRPTLISSPKWGLQHSWRPTGSTNEGNASWTINGIKDTGKVGNRRVAKMRIVLSLLLILVKKFIPWQLSHGSEYCCTNNANDMRLLVSSTFAVKKLPAEQITLYTHEFERKWYGLELGSSFLHNMQLHHTDQRTSILSYGHCSNHVSTCTCTCTYTLCMHILAMNDAFHTCMCPVEIFVCKKECKQVIKKLLSVTR